MRLVALFLEKAAGFYPGSRDSQYQFKKRLVILEKAEGFYPGSSAP